MNADRLLAHCARIADAPDAIARLRRFILDLAVRGKLLPQDPKDEPVAELLKRIAAEKARLVKAGEIRKPKALPEVEEPPFDVPHLWRWTRIREVTSDRGQAVPEADFTYIDVTAIDKENGIVALPKVLPASEAPSRARKITRKGDVIYSCVRPYLSNVAVIEDDFDPVLPGRAKLSTKPCPTGSGTSTNTIGMARVGACKGPTASVPIRRIRSACCARRERPRSRRGRRAAEERDEVLREDVADWFELDSDSRIC
jgi:hypothetical protein